ncbi:MAG: hypothetical protein PHR26_02770 [Candidatus ainarchaeum sp.]|nr:hypothetical protein [Candidatus ainarchaeum sp.]
MILLVSLFSAFIFAEDFDITDVSYSYVTYDYPIYPNVSYQRNYSQAGYDYINTYNSYATINPYSGTYYNSYPAYNYYAYNNYPVYTYYPTHSSYITPVYSSYTNYYPYNSNNLSYSNGNSYVSFTW